MSSEGSAHRRVRAGAWIALSALAGCTAPVPRPTPSLSSPHAVVWIAGNGWTTLTIDHDGTATYDYHPSGWGAGGQRPSKRWLTLSGADLDALAGVLRASAACSLHATNRAPVPEEGTQTLVLDLGGLSCTVSMLANDWSATPHAQPIARALDDLTERVRREGKRD